MDQQSESAPASAFSPPWFATTHWSVVLQAGDSSSPAAAEALGKLCRVYWKPIHAYVQRIGHNTVDAEDLTQQFFARFLQKEQYRLADPTRGKFRTFLLTSVRRFVINEWEQRCALKRGGGKELISLDDPQAEERHGPIEPVDFRTAESVYERAWGLAVLGQVRKRLQAEFEEAGQGKRFELLEKFLPGTERELTYAEAAACLGLTESTVRTEVHRLKNRYREVLRHEIGHTVSSVGEVEEELHYLLTVLSRPSTSWDAY